ncbi:uncharacterized protein LOC111377155 [Olea europaea var. sylvestris]|uniref:uncharacterized protein LOC111377155 n=1 Tax=Olea europaea var. sylvestris TaxID=158386 RepID=UPI000C1D8A7A|nr:uncharacterized protein LOC111377155 [Olea europaea var. sylvestris]
MVEAYVDDMVVKSKQLNNHVSNLEEVFATLRRYSMKLNQVKCAFGVASGKFLGFMITHRGIEVNPDKIQALISMEASKCKRDIQKLTGRVAALNMLVSRAADRCFPLFKLLRENNGFDWNEECNLAFQELKQTLSTLPVLIKPEPSDTLLLYLAVSQNASHPIVVLTNQPLRPILQKSDALGRLLKWAIELGEIDIEFKPRPTIKAQALANFIAELTPRSSETPAKGSNSTLETWEIFVDEASNSSGSRADIIITSPDKTTEIQCALKFEFEATNNEAEYEAIVIAVELAKNLECEHLKVFSDSQLVVGQIEGSFERKDEKTNLYCLKVHDLQRQFISCEILKVARAEDAKVDALSRLVFIGMDGLDRIVHIKMVAEPRIAQKPSVMDIDHEPSWMDPIVDYISNVNIPTDPRLARSIWYRAAKYCIIEGVLFRRSFTLPYLRCLRPFESLQPMTEVHEGICGNHQGARALAYKLIKYAYYWPSLKKDATDYVRKCDKCQKFGHVIHATAEELTSIHYSAPFEQWGVDILGPFPLARRQLKFIAVAVEYFTKWVEAEPLATISEPKLRISHKTATGETPFMLAFGLEATIPIEVSLPTIRKLEINRETQTTEHLDLLEEVREQASLRTASYQNRTAKHFNNKVQTRRIGAGDLVLRKAEAVGHQPGKLGPTWEGSYEVIRKLKGGAYSLIDTSGKSLPRPWNANNLKIYYK